MLRRLLVGVRELISFASLHGAADERHADRQPVGEAGGHRDARVSGDRRRRRAGAEEVIAVDEIGRPRRAAGRRDDRVEPELRVITRIDALRPRPRPAGRQRLPIGRATSAAPSSPPDEHLLTEERHLAFASRAVERDQLLQRVDRRGRAAAGEIRVEIRLELVEQDLELAVVEPCRRSECPPDRRSPRPAPSCPRSRRRSAGRWPGCSRSNASARRRCARPCSRPASTRPCSRGVRWPRAAAVAGSAGSTPAIAAEQNRRIGDRARHRAGGVLRVRDRNDARCG